jgi:hypothetical protein
MRAIVISLSALALAFTGLTAAEARHRHHPPHHYVHHPRHHPHH